MRLQHNSLPFLPPAWRFSALWLEHAQKSKFWDSFWRRKWPKSLGFLIFGIFFCLSFFSFSLVFAAVIDLLLDLLAVKKLLRKRHRDGQFLAWSIQVWWQEILPQVFHWTFWAFLRISKAPFGRSLWSGHHWKDLFLQQKLSIDDANFGQKWWRQKRTKGQGSSWAVTGGTGVNGLSYKLELVLVNVLQKLSGFIFRFQVCFWIYLNWPENGNKGPAWGFRSLGSYEENLLGNMHLLTKKLEVT